MKKLLIITILIVCFGYLMNAQTNYGIKFGAGLSTIALENVPDQLNDDLYKYRTSFLAGALISHELSDKFELSSELLYELKGTILKGDDFTEENKLSLHYISLPVLMQYKFFSRFSIEIGPQIGYRFAVDLEKLAESAPFTAEDIFNQAWDFSLNGGLTFYLSKNMLINTRYTHGLAQVSDLKVTDENGTPTVNVRQTNQMFQLSLGYKFKKG